MAMQQAQNRSSSVAHFRDDLRAVSAAVKLALKCRKSRQELAGEERVRRFSGGQRHDFRDGPAFVGEDDGLLFGGLAHPERGVLVQFADGNGGNADECGTVLTARQDAGTARRSCRDRLHVRGQTRSGFFSSPLCHKVSHVVSPVTLFRCGKKWRRGELNPCPKNFCHKLLHA